MQEFPQGKRLDSLQYRIESLKPVILVVKRQLHIIFYLFNIEFFMLQKMKRKTGGRRKETKRAQMRTTRNIIIIKEKKKQKQRENQISFRYLKKPKILVVVLK